jgi:hypothetical protein
MTTEVPSSTSTGPTWVSFAIGAALAWFSQGVANDLRGRILLLLASGIAAGIVLALLPHPSDEGKSTIRRIGTAVGITLLATFFVLEMLGGVASSIDDGIRLLVLGVYLVGAWQLIDNVLPDPSLPALSLATRRLRFLGRTLGAFFLLELLLASRHGFE